ncbi:MAG: glutathione peroxidase [Acholeplasmataceae bacterium]|nr:glutathione peroxidase [Acholeplasmataceae bacterium]
MTIHDFKVKDINNQDVALNRYKGKVMLIFNSATKCGLTPQYEGLEKLFAAYQSKGLELLDFPCNQFMNQAPGSNEELKSFCTLNYGTTFETFAKIDVNGKNADPLFKYLTGNAPDEISGEDGKKQGFLKRFLFKKKIKWNFTKFIVDRNGHILYRFSPGFKPEKMTRYIEEALK